MAATAAVYNQNRRVPPTVQIQKILDENAQLINTIQEFQSKGKAQEVVQFQQILHRNLVYLASVADSNQNIQSLLPPPSIHAQGMQIQQQQQQQQQQQPPPSVMLSGIDGQNPQTLQQQGPQNMNQGFTQGPGQMPPSGGYRLQQSIAPMRPPSQQYRPIQYQGQNYQNFASTQNNAVGSSQTPGTGGGNVYQLPNQSYPVQSYGHQQPVPNPSYANPSYGNSANQQQYQTSSPYANQPGNNYTQNVVASQPQNFPPNYPPVGYVQQPVNSNSTYGPGTNQPSSYAGYGNAPQITYVSSQTTQPGPSASTQTYPPPPNQTVAVAVQQNVPVSQPNYPAPQQPNAQGYQPTPNQQPVLPQNYPQQNYQPQPQGYSQGYPVPNQPSGYQPYPQRPLAPSNQNQYPGYSYQQSPV